MIPLPCATCRYEDGCLCRGVLAREAVFAWLNGQVVACDEYQPDWYHGLEGVLR